MTIESYQFIFDPDRLFYEELSEDMLSTELSWKLTHNLNLSFKGCPPEELIEEISNEFTNLKAEDAIIKVSILYELTSWLRKNGFSYKCLNQSYSLYYLDIATDSTEKQMSEYFRNIPARSPYVIDVQIDAFLCLGQLFKNHWIMQLDEDEGFYYHLDNKLRPLFGEIAGVFIYSQNQCLIQ